MRSEASARAAVESGRKRSAFGADHVSFGEFILSEEMRDVTADVAGDIMAAAKADTPLGDGGNGHMRDKYRLVREAGTMRVHLADRVKVEVHNDDPEAALVEFGSRNNDRRRMLGKAGALFGNFKSKKGKL